MPNSPQQSKPPLICLTGGGTAGHVTPHFALTPSFAEEGWQTFYIGSHGLEKPLVEAQGIPFYPISAGKLRRYLSWQNATDLFRVVAGFFQAYSLLGKLRPQLILSKGGFVAVPVAFAGWLRGIPVISHESDVSPGLANRMIGLFARRILFAFPETAQYIPAAKGACVGAPVRQELLFGDANAGRQLCRFGQTNRDLALPTLLIMGGSQGALRINEALKAILPDLVTRMQVIHLTGKGKKIEFNHPRYAAFEFVTTEFKDLLALATHVVSRAGANSIFELLAVQKPMLLIPLELGSRGDQILNAESFARQGWALTLRDRDLSGATLGKAVSDLIAKGPELTAKLALRASSNAAMEVVMEIKNQLQNV